MSNGIPINREHLLNLMQFWGQPNDFGNPGSARVEIDSARLAKLAGVSRSMISRILSGDRPQVTWKTVWRLARALRVPPEALMCGEDGPWEFASDRMQPIWDDLFETLGRARFLISVTRSLFTHLLPRELHARVGMAGPRGGEPVPVTPEQRAGREHQWRLQRRARQTSNYVLKIICSEDTVRYAGQAKPEWLEELGEEMRLHWEDTAVGLVGDDGWATIDGLISEHTGIDNWTKVNIADTTLACVYFGDHQSTHCVAYSYRPSKVQALRDLIDRRCAEEIPGPFPATKVNRGTLGGCHNVTVKNVWRRWLPGRPAPVVAV